MGHMANTGNNTNAYTVLVEKPLVRARGKWVNIKNGSEGEDSNQSDPRQGQVAGSCKRDNELSGSVKGGEFFDYLTALQGVRGYVVNDAISCVCMC